MKTKRHVLFLIACLCVFAASARKGTVSVEKIWDNGTHAAFTSLIKYRGQYYCSFREGYSHIFNAEGEADGKIRILRSRNGRKWHTVAYFGCDSVDLRDPKLSIAPDGRMMVTIGGSVYRARRHVKSIPMVCFTADGTHFSPLQPIEIDPKARTPKDWVWRVTWHDGVGYGVSYSSARRDTLSLLRTTDGIRYDLVCDMGISGFPNETTLRFEPDGTMLAMVRRDGADRQGYWATSRPPYNEWQWQPMGFQVGGQDFVTSDGTVILATRTYFTRHCKTALFRGTRGGDWEEVYVLPSDGDTSYPGLLIEGDEVWVSYYASTNQKGKAAIYLARLPRSLFDK